MDGQKSDDEERKLRTLVAHAIWQAQKEKSGDVDAAKTEWQQERPEMLKVAARAIRFMEKRGISLDLNEKENLE